MKYLLCAAALFCSVSLIAQVGIGTTSPTAELEINATTSGLPALEITPQANPVGTSTGQLSVIGDKLFMYDETRGKWLSVESSLLNFGLENGTDNQNLEYVGDILVSGPRMPLDGTIVYITMNASGGQANKKVELYKNNTVIPDNLDPSIDGELVLDGYTFTNTQYNLDFNEGDHFRVRVGADGSDVENLSVLLWVKWRK